MAEPHKTDWDKIRRHAISAEAPPGWPAGVRGISLDGVSLIGVHERTNELYWDGNKLVTERRLATFERALALIVTAATAIVAVVEVARFFTGT
jgi:hypothetical protein